MPPGIVTQRLAKPKELRCAIVRHGERADTSWDTSWPFTDDAQAYPYDPPITDVGRQQAKACGQRLLELSGPGTASGWRTVISSPFFRCVETAVEICKITGAPLIIDEDWGEVRFSEFFESEGGALQHQEPTRTHQFLAQYVLQKGVKLLHVDALKRGKAMRVRGPENRADARQRYARKFAEYLDRATLAQSSFIVVTHGESLPGCVPLFPAFRGAEVLSVPCCGMLVGQFEQPLPLSRKCHELHQSTWSDAYAAGGCLEGLSVLETTCELQGIPKTFAEPLRSAPLRSAPLRPASLGFTALMTEARKSRFRASFMLRKSQGFANSDNSTCATFQDMITLKHLGTLPSYPLRDTIECGAECDEVAKNDDDFETGVGYLELPPETKREVSGSSTTQQMHSIDESALGRTSSDVGSSFCEREYTVEAVIDVGSGCSWTSFEMSGLLTDPTFKKIPSCRSGRKPQRGQMSCSPMGCARMGPFARLSSSPDSKGQDAGGPFAKMPASPDSKGRAPSSSFAKSCSRVDVAKSLGNCKPTKPSPKLAFVESLDSSAIEERTKKPPKHALGESLDLCAIEGNSLWERRQARRPPPVA
jgi:broad specificity phosphatase PhoE